MDEGMPRETEGSFSVPQMLQMILNRLDRFPVERLVRMEAELQQSRALLEEESRDRKSLDDQMHQLAREFQELVDKRIEASFQTCRQDRDLRLARLNDRIDVIQTQDREERSLGVKMKVAVISAVGAFVISIVNAVISLCSHK